MQIPILFRSDVDPESIKQELIKCRIDPIYFIDTYIVRTEPGGIVNFGLYGAQKNLIKSMYNDHYTMVLKSRQIGISTVVQAYIIWLTIFNKNMNVAIISRNSNESTDFVRKCKLMFDGLPTRLKPKWTKRIEQLLILNNKSRITSTQVNSSNPESVLRGESISFLVMDEAAFIEKVDKAYSGLAPTLATVAKVSKKKGLPYGLAILSTPNGVKGNGEWYYKMWLASNKGDDIFKPIRIHYSEAPFADDEWLATNKKLLHNNDLSIRQELELQFISPENAFFESEVTINLLDSQAKYKTTDVTTIPYFDMHGNKVGTAYRRIFEDYNPTGSYLIGVDISSSYSLCNSAIEVFRYPEMTQVEEFVGKLPIPDLKNEVISLAKKYENSLVIPENNSYGVQMSQELYNDDLVGNKLYLTRIESEIDGSIKRIIPGLVTSGKTKPLIVEALYWSIKEDPSRIKSEILVDELIGLSGNFQSKMLTDLAMASGFCFYVSKYDIKNIEYNLPINNTQTSNLVKTLFFDDVDKDKEYVNGLVKKIELNRIF